MKIAIIRHVKVIFRDSVLSTGKAFDEGRSLYDTLPIEAHSLKIDTSEFPRCYVSSKPRAIETARIIYPGAFRITDKLVEVKNASFFLRRFKIPTILRKILGRAAWFFNYHKMPETRKRSMARAKSLIREMLAESNQNTLLITHGFFMYCLKYELLKNGFKGKLSFPPKNAVLYLFEKID